MKNRYDYLKAKFGAFLKLRNKLGNVYNPTTNTQHLQSYRRRMGPRNEGLSLLIFEALAKNERISHLPLFLPSPRSLLSEVSGWSSTTCYLRLHICFQNVLGIFGFDMIFTFVWAGWEGITHDSRVLKEVSFNPTSVFPFRPPDENYLFDAAYTNTRGFMAPYSNTRTIFTVKKQNINKTPLLDFANGELGLVISTTIEGAMGGEEGSITIHKKKKIRVAANEVQINWSKAHFSFPLPGFYNHPFMYVMEFSSLCNIGGWARYASTWNWNWNCWDPAVPELELVLPSPVPNPKIQDLVGPNPNPIPKI
ncbi:hypothetical protein LXL04_008240 [Taraxacum kok-saghyz]